MTEMLVPDIQTKIRHRAQNLCDKLFPHWKADQLPFSCFIGGGAISGEVGGGIRDIDMFPISNQEIPAPDVAIVAKTTNAITFDTQPNPLQICDYSFPTVEELVKNFDFSHNQIAIEVTFNQQGVEIENLYHTPQFIWAKCNNTTSYECSNYPISSLIRAAKYRERGLLKGVDYAQTVLRILADIITLEVKSKEEFNQQILAVDLGLFDEIKDSEEFNLLLVNLLKVQG